jgi:hypothetical protein
MNFLSKIFLAVGVFLSLSSFAHDKEITIKCTEAQAIISADGQQVGVGMAKIKIKKNFSVTVEISLPGFIKYKNTYYNDDSHPKLDAEYTIELFKDESYESSVNGGNIANQHVNINSSKDEDKSWKVISEVVTTNFDILEVSDKSTGYIRTAWQTQSLGGKTIRTRIIIKGLSTDSKASYKIKIISEFADKEGISAQQDESFKPWDRLLKKYSSMIPELQERLE